MRFMPGTRSNTGKKGGASQMFRDRMNAKEKGMPEPGMAEVYKKAIEARMAKMLEDYLLGKKKAGAKLPGTKEPDETPREIPKSTQRLLKMLAEKREMKERKLQKKRELAFLRAKKAKIAEEQALIYQQEEELRLQMEAAERAARESSEGGGSWW